MRKRTLAIALLILMALLALWLLRGRTAEGTDVSGETAAAAQTDETPAPAAESEAPLDEQGTYTTKEDVSAYLAQYGKLPWNFITKAQARSLGWEGGALDEYAYGRCIGGDSFGNYEGLLPEGEGRSYYECDINTLHADSRGAERIVYSGDGLIYYTNDHYESFSLLYGTP